LLDINRCLMTKAGLLSGNILMCCNPSVTHSTSQ
jgi:hypothetical protein